MNTCPVGTGIWAVYYADRSAVWVYGEEIDALRAAVEHSAQVTWWPFGKSLDEAANGSRL